MLFNLKWSESLEKKVEAPSDPMSLDTLISWLERQVPTRKYDFINGAGCLLAQYFQSHGMPKAVVDPSRLYPKGAGMYGGGGVPLPRYFNDIARGTDREWTFGQALARARTYQK